MTPLAPASPAPLTWPAATPARRTNVFGSAAPAAPHVDTTLIYELAVTAQAHKPDLEHPGLPLCRVTAEALLVRLHLLGSAMLAVEAFTFPLLVLSSGALDPFVALDHLRLVCFRVRRSAPLPTPPMDL